MYFTTCMRLLVIKHHQTQLCITCLSLWSCCTADARIGTGTLCNRLFLIHETYYRPQWTKVHVQSSPSLNHIGIDVPIILLYSPLSSSSSSLSFSLLSSSLPFIFLKDHQGKSTVLYNILLGRHGSVSLCRVERENKMAATYMY